MHGNAWEWCWDWYGDYPNELKADYAGASSGLYRMLRGGDGRNSYSSLRSAYRKYSTPYEYHYDPTVSFQIFGLRVVRSQN
ncbi:MAG: SUMF1/EgtB/PvdO family nonheme iron enzyme [Spirochaetaceae bacterium]|nr:SUMF1/EgtB/PvdO family nonheme iron enzyme [Spirochaetaceae bacterium]